MCAQVQYIPFPPPNTDIPDPEQNAADEQESGESSEDDVGGTISKCSTVCIRVPISVGRVFSKEYLGTLHLSKPLLTCL